MESWIPPYKCVDELRGQALLLLELFTNRDEGLLDREKSVNNMWIKMSPRILENDPLGDFVSESIFVNPLAGQGVIDIRQRDNPGAQRNLLGLQVRRISAAVVTLVMRRRDVPRHPEVFCIGKALQRRVQRLCADRGV